METSNIINIVAIAILVIFTLTGLIKGFTKSFISTFGTIMAIFASATLCSAVALTLESKFSVITFFSDKVSGIISNIFGQDVLSLSVQDVLSGSNSSIPDWIIKIITSIVNIDSGTALKPLESVISPVFGYYITLVISFILIFILLKILLFLLGKFLSKINKIKVFGATDKILGALLGLIKSVIIVQILILIIKAIPITFLQSLSLEIEKSTVCNVLTKIDLISVIISAITNPKGILDIIKNIRF